MYLEINFELNNAKGVMYVCFNAYVCILQMREHSRGKKDQAEKYDSCLLSQKSGG